MSKNIVFDHETGKWQGITVEYVKSLEKAYPDCDIIDILTNKMPKWLDANPKKAKKKNWKRFITNWLSRQQSRYDEIRFLNKG